MTDNNHEPSLSVAQAAAQLDVNPITLYRWIREGYCHALRIGPSRLRIPATEITRLLSQPAQPARKRE